MFRRPNSLAKCGNVEARVGLGAAPVALQVFSARANAGLKRFGGMIGCVGAEFDALARLASRCGGLLWWAAGEKRG